MPRLHSLCLFILQRPELQTVTVGKGDPDQLLLCFTSGGWCPAGCFMHQVALALTCLLQLLLRAAHACGSLLMLGVPRCVSSLRRTGSVRAPSHQKHKRVELSFNKVSFLTLLQLLCAHQPDELNCKPVV